MRTHLTAGRERWWAAAGWTCGPPQVMRDPLGKPSLLKKRKNESDKQRSKKVVSQHVW